MKKRKLLSRIANIFVLFLLGIIVSGILFFSIFIYYIRDFPKPEIFTERNLKESSKIFDRTGTVLLYEIYGEERRTPVPLEKISAYLKNAVVATEDKNFYKHFGVDIKGVGRAILADLKIGEPVYGASSIPQQLIRSTFLSNKKTAERKIREVVLAIELDRRYSKDKILEWYLNQIPFGQNAYGVEAASQTYFNKSANQISLAEAAALTALIKAPYNLSPYEKKGKERLLQRKDYVLNRMVEEKYLKKDEGEKAKKEEIIFKEKKTELKAPYFILWVLEKLKNDFGKNFLEEEGLKIYTTLNWDLQGLAEKSLKEGIGRNKTFNAYNGAITAIDPKNGNVLAMSVGTGNYYEKPYPEGCISGKTCLFDPQFNAALGTKESPGRQPGSSFKPFIYAAAFERGYNDKTMIMDDPTNFGVWGGKEYLPQNYDGKFRGLITTRSALSQSLNIPSIKVLYLVGSEEKIERLTINDFRQKENILTNGLEKSIALAQNLGITTLSRSISFYGPALVLGGGEVNLLEMTSAYSVFANDGVRNSPSVILKIEDKNKNIIFKNNETSARILSSQTASLITDILSDNESRAPMFGSRSHLYFKDYKVAAKTGTTDNFKDCWTIGYFPQVITVGVWVGNNNNAPMVKKQPASTVAGPIFHDFLENALKFLVKTP